jgi:hypothetical protein
MKDLELIDWISDQLQSIDPNILTGVINSIKHKIDGGTTFCRLTSNGINYLAKNNSDIINALTRLLDIVNELPPLPLGHTLTKNEFKGMNKDLLISWIKSQLDSQSFSNIPIENVSKDHFKITVITRMKSKLKFELINGSTFFSLTDQQIEQLMENDSIATIVKQLVKNAKSLKGPLSHFL